VLAQLTSSSKFIIKFIEQTKYNLLLFFRPSVDIIPRDRKKLRKEIIIIIIFLFFLTLGTYDPEGDEKLRKLIYKLGYDHQSVRSVNNKLQTVVQKDSIVALYQHRDPLIQKAGLPSLARA